MKRNILAVVISVMLAASSVNAVEIYNKDNNHLHLYGTVHTMHFFTKEKSDYGDHSHLRAGLHGESKINNKITGYGEWEYDSKINHIESKSSQSIRTLLGFVGVKVSKYGSLDYGRNYGILYNVEKWTDTLPQFGGDTYSFSDNFMTTRTNNILTYRNNNFFNLVHGLNFSLQYQGKNEKFREMREQNGEGWGISARYNFVNNITASAAYTYSNHTKLQKQYFNNDNLRAETGAISVKYDADNVYLAGTYAETRNITPFGGNNFSSKCQSNNGNCGGLAGKTQNVELTAQYQFDWGLRPSVSYLRSKGIGIKLANTSNHEDLIKYISIGGVYKFDKNVLTYFDYKINLLHNNTFTRSVGLATDNILAIGLVYNF
ncbi:Outer membrane protein C [Candidatus Ecksteinia adelgidicola]|nr:Outer membrane protein C [Candidatus Ecksteinia adelgidicola]